MAEFVATLVAAVGAGGTTAAGTAAAGTATAGTAAASSSVLTALQGLGTGFAVLSTIGAGAAQAAELRARAEEQELQARAEYISGVEQSARLKRALSETLQRQAVQFSAGGVDLGSVSVREARALVVRDAERELGFAQNDALRASLARQRAAHNLRSQSRAAFTGSLFAAGSRLAMFGADVAERG